jgi:DNA-binding NarL/FixJ family response regulator
VAVQVFLVEDMKQLQGAMTDLLASLGDFKIAGIASTEAEARLWLDENQGRWQLAVLDLILQQGTGMGVIAKCREHAAGARVVVFSDYATPGIRAHCLKLGADAVFMKSGQTADFIAYCSALLAPP